VSGPIAQIQEISAVRPTRSQLPPCVTPRNDREAGADSYPGPDETHPELQAVAAVPQRRSRDDGANGCDHPGAPWP
jgi:hypothetical protein